MVFISTLVHRVGADWRQPDEPGILFIRIFSTDSTEVRRESQLSDRLLMTVASGNFPSWPFTSAVLLPNHIHVLRITFHSPFTNYELRITNPILPRPLHSNLPAGDAELVPEFQLAPKLLASQLAFEQTFIHPHGTQQFIGRLVHELQPVASRS